MQIHEYNERTRKIDTFKGLLNTLKAEAKILFVIFTLIFILAAIAHISEAREHEVRERRLYGQR